MAQNTSPIFGLNIKNTWTGAVTTAETSTTAPSAATLAGTAGANGTYVKRLLIKPLGTNIQTVARVFVNNGSTPGTASNNSLIKEFTLPATTASANAALIDIEIFLGLWLAPSYKIYVALGTTVSAGWTFMQEQIDY